MNPAQLSPLELSLSSFVDNENGEVEKHEIEEMLVNDPQTRALHDQLKRGADFGRRAFDDMLKEPVPLDLVRTIKNAPLPRRAVRLPQAPGPFLNFKPSGRQALTAAVLLFIIGGSLGYMVGTQPAMPNFNQLNASADNRREWLDDIVSHYRLYAHQQPAHLAEIPADRPADILEWLTTSTGVGFRIPDLSASKLTFVGARLFPANGLPAGQLLYRRTDDDGDGDVIAITFARIRQDGNRSIEEIRNDTAIVSWVTPLATYLIIGPSGAADLDDIASKAAGLI